MDYYRLITIVYMLLHCSRSLALPPHRENLAKDDRDFIVFPDDLQQQSNHFIPKVRSRPCRGPMNFCEDVIGYPHGYVEDSLKEEAKNYEHMFEMEDIDNDNELRTMDNEDGFGCPTKREWKFPKIALNARNEWKYIYNNDKHKQGIRLEYCQRKNSPCIVGQIGLFKTECKQKYIRIKMLTIGYKGNLEQDSFMQPVACCCSIKPLIAWNAS